jgi:protein TonB
VPLARRCAAAVALTLALARCASDCGEARSKLDVDTTDPATRSFYLALNEQMPNYPAAACKNHEEGRVIIAFTLHPDGSITDVRLDASSGSTALDSASVDAVRRIQASGEKLVEFAMRYAHGTDAQVRVPLDYALE